MNGLKRLESWITQLVEEPFVRLFAGRLLPEQVARALAHALEDGERIGADGAPEVPGRYRIALHPDDLTALQRHHPNLEAHLAEALHKLAERMDVRLITPPAVILHPNPRVPLRTIQISPADRAPRSTEKTRDFDLERLQTRMDQERAAPTQAYLILADERAFDLTTPAVRIGRALDNDLIIEDRRVSRYHAQMRRRYGRYILQDLGSTGGIRVNGFPVQEIVLRPGDLISLSGVELIYAEDTRREATARSPEASSSSATANTRSFPPPER